MSPVLSARDVVRVIESDRAAMDVLRATATLGLPDWWIGAGFVRNRVWDAISDLPVAPERDVDVAYFDPDRPDPGEEARAEARAVAALPGVPWEIRNQARMHLRNGDEPYTSALDAISRWPETATCVAVTLRGDAVHLMACHGLADLVGMVVRPSPAFADAAGRATVRRRVEVKGWRDRWAGLRLEI
ncbi:nucleotidyltransferase family protein [Micromonospora coxensis]|uniref:nucleotidyltransferase family protein n=1 Tax=Micromonospora coxensis TaxID=356852 RepID=UPI003435E39F